MITIEQLKVLKEQEDKVEYKESKGGNYSYNGGSKLVAKERRHCILGYVVALANEGGGMLVFGISDKYPHVVVGSSQNAGSIGLLEANIYRDLKIRVQTQELFEEGKRVLVLHVPSRPVGKVFKFEDVALMRVGDELLPMSDQHYLKILQEQEPDFSSTVCKQLAIEDLDDEAFERMRQAFAQKQNNKQFLTLSKKQALNDLDLITPDGKVKYAALILLGKREKIKELLPQAAIFYEYRNNLSQIPFDRKEELLDPYFILFDRLWAVVDSRNGNVPVQSGPYIFDIPFFNREVIREAINNAVAHRDYRRQSEVLIKQYPTELIISNPGGFPLGVTLENIITINSTPRNRLLAEVLAKTGIVERSGQGVDKIYYQSIAEAKDAPDYTASDDFQVVLKLSGVVKDKAFALFIEAVQSARADGEKLNVEEVITLDQVRRGIDKNELSADILKKLQDEGLIEKVGKTKRQFYRLSMEYYSFTEQEHKYSNDSLLSDEEVTGYIMRHVEKFGSAKMDGFTKLLEKFNLTREQTKHAVYKLAKDGFLEVVGKGTSTEYKLSKDSEEKKKLHNKALQLGLEEMERRGEIPSSKPPKQEE